MKSKRHELTYFFLIAFAWMWLLNLPRVLDSFGILKLPAILSAIIQYTAVFAPGLAAFILTGLKSGKAGMKTLWRRGWDHRFPKIWWLPTLLLVPVSGVLTVLILLLFNKQIPWEYSLPPAMIVPIGLVIWLFGAYPEEFGWRGYALDRLQTMFKPLTASLILGALWALWHLPLHFIEGTTQFVIPFWEYAAQTIVLTVIYTWLHNNTGGSILAASLFHAMGNITGAIIPYWTTTTGRWVNFLILLVFAIIATQIKFKHKPQLTQEPP